VWLYLGVSYPREQCLHLSAEPRLACMLNIGGLPPPPIHVCAVTALEASVRGAESELSQHHLILARHMEEAQAGWNRQLLEAEEAAGRALAAEQRRAAATLAEMNAEWEARMRQEGAAWAARLAECEAGWGEQQLGGGCVLDAVQAG
jgi:hypothetical protein